MFRTKEVGIFVKYRFQKYKKKLQIKFKNLHITVALYYDAVLVIVYLYPLSIT